MGMTGAAASGPWLEATAGETTLAEGPSRRVVRLEAKGAGGGAAMVAKFYPEGEGARAARLLESLHAAVARAASPALGVPRPLGYDPLREVLFQDEVPGVRFDALLAGPRVPEALDRAGRALATLHGLEVEVGPVRRLRDHLDDLVRPHPGALARALPELAPRVVRILDALDAAEARWRPRVRAVPVHRDVHARQLFLDGRRVWLVDWDLCARGDGALDLGNFVGWLRARRDADDAAIDALLGGYAAAGDAEVIARVPLHEAFTYLRLACKRFRLGEAGWREGCAALVARAERCLSKGT